jgi:hypothetical protein
MRNWNNLSDDELDQLFRQTADESHVKFEEKAWEAMQTNLDKNQPKGWPSFWKKYTPLLLLLLFVSGTAIYFGGQRAISKKEEISKIENANNQNQGKELTKNSVEETNSNLNEQIKQIEGIDVKEDQITDLPNNKTNSPNSQKVDLDTNPISRIAEIPAQSNNNKITKNQSNKNSGFTQNTLKINEKLAYQKQRYFKYNKSINLAKDNKSTIDNNPENLVSDKEETIRAISNETESIDLKNANTLKIKSNKPNNNQNFYSENDAKNTYKDNPLNTQNKDQDSVNEMIVKTVLQGIALNNLKGKSNFSYSPPIFTKSITTSEYPKPVVKIDPFFKKGLSVRLAASPDISKVGNNKIEKIGSNLGLLLDYRLSKRWVLQAGIIKSTKYYDAYPEQYNWVWGKPVSKLLEIAAKCQMIDYPINIRYDIVANPKSRIFGLAGLTTYKMVNETYDYDYEDNSNPTIRWRQWKGKTGTYYTSNLNLSVGFEKQIAKKLTLQIEPFAKAPLKEIGFGKVPLITYGMMFSANVPLNNLFKK